MMEKHPALLLTRAGPDAIIITTKNRIKTDDAEITAGNAATESPGCWDPGAKRLVKWTAEGAGNSFGPVSCDVRHTSVAAGVTAPGKCAAPLRIKVAPRIVFVLERSRISWGLFYFPQGERSEL